MMEESDYLPKNHGVDPVRSWLDSLRDWVMHAEVNPSAKAWAEARTCYGCVVCLARQQSTDQSEALAEAAEYATQIPDFGVDCRECGLCCSPDSRALRMTIDLTQEEGARIETLCPGSTRPYERDEVRVAYRFEAESTPDTAPDAFACMFHRGAEGCSIYNDRPNVCREFPPGCTVCLHIRERHSKPTPP